jgi:hypothetical protein
MAALSVTAANVLLVSGVPLADASAGEAFAAGSALYQSSSDGKWYKGKGSGTADQAGAVNTGLALFTADVAGARGDVATADGNCIVAIGAGLAGSVYYLGATAGQLNPFADLVSTNKSTPVCLGIGSNKVKMLRAYDPGSVIP